MARRKKTMTEFGKRLNEAYGDVQYKIIAEKLGLSKPAVTSFMQGHIPKTENLIKISEQTGFSIKWLLTGQGGKRDVTFITDGDCSCGQILIENPKPEVTLSAKSLPSGPDYICINCLIERLGYLEQLINSPQTEDFLTAIPLEAAFQTEHWGKPHDADKTALDWFWLIGYLAQKVVFALTLQDFEKARHHTISTAAVLMNWFRQIKSAEPPPKIGDNGKS